MNRQIKKERINLKEEWKSESNSPSKKYINVTHVFSSIYNDVKKKKKKKV